MLNKTRAIVLHHVKYGESSIIATLYTEKYGRIACMVNGIRSKKARFPSVFFQPLSLLDADIYYRQNRGIQKLKEAGCSIHYSTIPFDILKSTIALFLAEVLYISLREEESNPALFTFVYHSLQILDTKDSEFSSFHLWFMFHLSRYLGFYPVYYIDGSQVAGSETEAFMGMSKGSADGLRRIAENPQGPPDFTGISPQQRNELLERIIRYYSLHMDGFSRIQSYKVLHEVFNG